MVAVALAVRPVLAVDETRYLSVAWEMWLRGDWLVPHLNGEPYHHKPPLLFWLINAGWHVIGVSEVWGRLVAPLFSVATFFVVVKTARLLWPYTPYAAFMAPLILLGLPLFAGAGSMTMFDIMLTFWAALGVLGTVITAKGSRWLGLPLYAAAIGLGVLTKGPVILVFLLPPALLAPVWCQPPTKAKSPALYWLAWYGGTGLAIAVGAAIALAWALPAAQAGGEEFADALLWRQTAGRIVDSFAHERPVWWYAIVLLPILLPWTAWFGFWRGLARHVRPMDREIRLLLIWVLVPVIIMTFVSAKQVQYLLPMFPAIALLVARMAADEPTTRWSDVWLPAGLVLLLGFLLTLIPLAADAIQITLGLDDLPGWIDEVSVVPGVTLLVLGVGLVFAGRRSLANQVTLLCAIAPVLFISVHLGVLTAMGQIYGVDTTAWFVSRVQDQGHPVAYLGNYHGQFQFVGRLERPIEPISHKDLETWLGGHPDGYLIAVLKDLAPETAAAAEQTEAYRSRLLTVWTSEKAIAHRDVFR